MDLAFRKAMSSTNIDLRITLKAGVKELKKPQRGDGMKKRSL